jgi:RNA polymerase sigma-70 factor (ECF subfamily)
MNAPDTEIGGASRAFPVTSWTLLDQARREQAGGGGAAVDRLVRLYWKPVYVFLRRSGLKSNEDAKDLAQDFFLRIVLDGSLLGRYDAERGGFRALLKASLRNFLAQVRRDGGAQKRGGGAPLLSLAGLEGDGADVLADARSIGPEEAFDLAWRRSVLSRALERLEARLRREGKAPCWEVFRRYELADGSEAPSYQAVGASLGLSPDTVKNHLTSARKGFLEAAKEILYQEVDGPEELSRELSALFRT